MQKFVALIAFLLLTQGLLADSTENKVYIPIYRGAEVVDSETAAVKDWLLALAKYQKINGEWQFSNSEYLSGQLQRNTYLVRSPDLYNNIASYYQTWANSDAVELLFSCKNRYCGASNKWANEYFKQRRLLGLDAKQRYWAVKAANTYMAVYFIERGNGQKFLQVDQLTVSDS